ncbi:hypothetical protein [Chamaesiphon sp. VAR_48_metabat_403]|uniref:hypothetical protein n=1 Tax=Chamaesiphon sp. VAR_48_metabat_403 TaxID=2964700 RepID=UPI00286EAD4E|nr:hypothetical protein [Chamaesiphon sp. VAR_48_metabat_403]
METKFKIPDPETRAKTLAKLREARHQGDLAILMLDETLALADAHLLQQRRERLLGKTDLIIDSP